MAPQPQSSRPQTIPPTNKDQNQDVDMFHENLVSILVVGNILYYWGGTIFAGMRRFPKVVTVLTSHLQREL